MYYLKPIKGNIKYVVELIKQLVIRANNHNKTMPTNKTPQKNNKNNNNNNNNLVSGRLNIFLQQTRPSSIA